MVEDVKTENKEIDVQKLMEQYDSESRVRNPLGIMAIIISIIAISFSAFQFYTGGFGLLLALKQRAVHLTFTLCLAFLIYPGGKKSFNKNKEIIPQAIIEKAPSAELMPNQTDQDTLPPYELLDKILRMYLEENKEYDEIREVIGNEEIVKI